MTKNLKQDAVIFGFHALVNALQLKPETIDRIYLQKGRDDERLQQIIELAKQHKITLERLPKKNMDDNWPGNHQGMVAMMQRDIVYHESDLAQLISAAKKPLILILDEVQDPHNFGACLRSANGFGVTAVICPKDRASPITATVRKVASGAVEATPVIFVTNLARTMRELQQQGIWIVGTSDQASSTLREIDLSGAIAIVMGNEQSGMRRLTAEHCDFLAKIPLFGTVSSLNVSVATGICLYEAIRQR